LTTLEQVRKRADADAKTYGYYLTPQSDLLQMFTEGLKTNEDRYGYPSCPCRLATGNFETSFAPATTATPTSPNMVRATADYTLTKLFLIAKICLKFRNADLLKNKKEHTELK
jgi:ferredoxin-thioredoxin reductase catalytic subunit